MLKTYDEINSLPQFNVLKKSQQICVMKVIMKLVTLKLLKKFNYNFKNFIYTSVCVEIGHL